MATFALSADGATRKLRGELDRITRTFQFPAEPFALGKQPDKIADLAVTHRLPHSIRLLEPVVPGRPDTSEYNCHWFAFGLRHADEVWRIYRESGGKIFPWAEWVTRLIDTVLTETDLRCVSDGDVAIYHHDGQIEHSAVRRGETFISKWGQGHLWEHALHEVPARYGDEVRFFRHVPPELCLAAFLQYAQAKGAP